MQTNKDSRAAKYFAQAKGEAACLSTSELKAEIENRERKNLFPLDVFHPHAREILTILHTHFDIPRSFAGLLMLTAYSSAIGTAYSIRRSSGDIYMIVWACLEGMTSSGKTLPYKILFEPLTHIQSQFDREWQELSRLHKSKDSDTNLDLEPLKTVLFRDVHIATLVRSVLPDNPKGVTKEADEILEWINGLNSLARKEGTDEQFWLSAWNGGSYSGVRSGREKFSMERVFVNVVGGIQPSVTHKLFKNDRDTTGFIFRILFATPEETRIAMPDSDYQIPREVKQQHNRVLSQLYNLLPVQDERRAPKSIIISSPANKLHHQWRKEKAQSINRMQDHRKKEIQAGILGKISEYTIRFSGLLRVADLSYENRQFPESLTVEEAHMERAIKLADYFFNSAWEVYSRVVTDIVAPAEVLRFASYVRAGFNNQRIGDAEFKTIKSPEARRKRASRALKKYIEKYPNVFRAKEKS